MNLLTNVLLQSKERDMKHIIRVWKVGIEGAQALKHEIKYQEAMLNFAIMHTLWPGENAIRHAKPLRSGGWLERYRQISDHENDASTDSDRHALNALEIS